MILATSTPRAVGLVILAIVVVGTLAYLLFNMLSGKKEVGSEIELAPNRKPYYPDEVLETKKLDRSLTMALLGLGVIGVTLPLYWLAEPGRQEGAVAGFDDVFRKRGTALYEQYCANCHGQDGGGGVAGYTITDDTGAFVAQVDWVVPGLTTVLSRFSEDEVAHVLNWGRGVMPAWGEPGGGALTSQQIEELIRFMWEIQRTDEAEIQEEVLGGVQTEALTWVLDNDPAFAEDFAAANEALAEAREAEDDEAIAAAQAEVTEVRERAAPAAERLVERITAENANERDQILYGELLFNNTAGNGEFNCARCHTNGWSYGARSDATTEALIAEWPRLGSSGILTQYAPGAGAFGPSLWSVANAWPTVEGHVGFVTAGGGFGPNDSNQMPGFGGREAEGRTGEDGNPFVYPAILTQQQIAAIVAYERSLGE